MCRAIPIAVVLLMWFFAAAAADNELLGAREASVKVDGPVIVGYFPRVSEKEMEDPTSGASEGLAHVSFALEDTLKCLKAAGIVARAKLEMATALVVTDGQNTKKITLPTTWPAASGVYLFSPGKAPRSVPAQSGPSSLMVLAPEAAAAYFQAPTCRPQEPISNDTPHSDARATAIQTLPPISVRAVGG